MQIYILFISVSLILKIALPQKIETKGLLVDEYIEPQMLFLLYCEILDHFCSDLKNTNS